MSIPSFNPDKNYLVYIVDILDSIDLINEYIHDIDEIQFSQDIQLQDAIIRRFQIIGEASAKIPGIIRDRFPNIPWKKIVAQRNLIIHNYAKVRPSEIWQVIIADLPTLKKQLLPVKKALSK